MVTDKGNHGGDSQKQPVDKAEGQLSELQKDVQHDGRTAGATSVDATRTAAEALNGPRHEWTSVHDAKFAQQTKELMEQSPEQINAAIALNTQRAEAMQKHIAALTKNVDQVVARANAQAALEAANRVG